MKTWDRETWLFAALMLLIVGLWTYAIAGTAWVKSNCTATTDTRLGSRLMPAGKVAIPQTVVETRYVCPNGREVWL